VGAPSKDNDVAAPPAAIACILGGYFLFAFLDTSGKYLVLSGLDPLFVAWMRFAVHLVLVLILFRCWRHPERLRAQSLPAQVLRGIFLFGSTIFNFMALRYLQLAETTSIYFFGPMVITALAGPLLGEWAGWRRWLAIVVGFVGVVVITRPGVGNFGVGHALALGSMLSNSLYVIMTRSMGARESAESLILYSALAPVVLLAPALPATASMPSDAWHWLILFLPGVFGAFGHWFLIKAYQHATATALAPYPYLQMLWMIGLGWLVFDQLPDGWTLAGAAIIVASGLYIVHREQRLRTRMRAGLDSGARELAKKL
jgi:drug/metabolite transporter (DMT)-like permease